MRRGERENDQSGLCVSLFSSNQVLGMYCTAQIYESTQTRRVNQQAQPKQKLAQRGLIPLLSRGSQDMAKRPKTALISEPSLVGFLVNKLPSFLLVKVRCLCLSLFFCHLPFLPQVPPPTQLHLPPSIIQVSSLWRGGLRHFAFSLLPPANKLGIDGTKSPFENGD